MLAPYYVITYHWSIFAFNFQLPDHPLHLTIISILQAPEGIHCVYKRFPSLKIVTSEIDDALNEEFRVIPGMGEFGDRYFGTDDWFLLINSFVPAIFLVYDLNFNGLISWMDGTDRHKTWKLGTSCKMATALKCNSHSVLRNRIKFIPSSFIIKDKLGLITQKELTRISKLQLIVW